MQNAIKTAAITILISILLENKVKKFEKEYLELSLDLYEDESGVKKTAFIVIRGMQNNTKIPIAFTFACKVGSLISTMAGIAITENIPSRAISSLRVRSLVLSS